MRNKVVLVIALVFGLLAAFLVYNYISGAKKAIEQQAYTQVVVAAADIPANTTITENMVVMKPYPTQLRNNKEVVDLKEAIGKVSNVSLTKGEVILDSNLVKPGESTAKLSFKVPNGMRAMSVSVNEVSGVAHLIKVGDRVDIIGVIPETPNNPNPRASAILQNIEVIAVGSSLSDKPPAAGEKSATPNTVTLALDPQSTLRLKMALQVANYNFTLRAAGDKSFANLVPVIVNEL